MQAACLAHVSVSPGSAARCAQSASDLIIQAIRSPPLLLAVDVARRANRLVVQNFWMAALYNALAVPLAMAVLSRRLIARCGHVGLVDRGDGECAPAGETVAMDGS